MVEVPHTMNDAVEKSNSISIIYLIRCFVFLINFNGFCYCFHEFEILEWNLIMSLHYKIPKHTHTQTQTTFLHHGEIFI